MSKAKTDIKYVGHGSRPGWWVYARARISKHNSACGPFQDPEDAAKHVKMYYNPCDWGHIKIVLRNGNRR